MALASIPLLEPWRASRSLAGALAGYVFFTVVLWGSIYYHLRTGAPWTNGLRFWRLVLTNSDPTSGNALEQVPKLVMTLSAGNLLAEDADLASVGWIAIAAGLAAAAGTIAWRAFARRRLPRYPGRAEAASQRRRRPLARRVYVIVVDGCNRGRLWQAHAPVMDRLAREGTEYLAVEPAYPARTVVCFSSMLTGAAPAEHGMRSNFAPRLGVRCESVFDVLERHGRRGRLVGIAHLLDPFGEDVVRSVTSVQPTERIDHSLVAEGRARGRGARTPTCSCSSCSPPTSSATCAACATPSTSTSSRRPTARSATSSRFLEERGKLDDATVILMADHGQGRGIGGHGHLDWGEPPVPFVVCGAGARPGAVCREPRSVCELASTVSALLGVEAPAAARGRPMVPVLDSCVERGASAGRALAVVVGPRRGAGRWAACWPASRPRRAGCRWTCCWWTTARATPPPPSAASTGAGALARASRGLGAAAPRRPGVARDEGYAAAVYLDGDGEYDPADFARVLDPVARGRARLRDRLALPRAARGDELAPHARQPDDQRTGRSFMRERWPATPSRATAPSPPARSLPPAYGTTTTTPRCSLCRSGGLGIEPVEVPIRTAGARAGARSFATPSTWCAWRPPSGASGGPRARRGGAPPRRSRRRAETARCRAVEVREQLGERPERGVRPAGHERAAEKRASA